MMCGERERVGGWISHTASSLYLLLCQLIFGFWLLNWWLSHFQQDCSHLTCTRRQLNKGGAEKGEITRPKNDKQAKYWFKFVI